MMSTLIEIESEFQIIIIYSNDPDEPQQHPVSPHPHRQESLSARRKRQAALQQHRKLQQREPACLHSLQAESGLVECDTKANSQPCSVQRRLPAGPFLQRALGQPHSEEPEQPERPHGGDQPPQRGGEEDAAQDRGAGEQAGGHGGVLGAASQEEEAPRRGCGEDVLVPLRQLPEELRHRGVAEPAHQAEAQRGHQDREAAAAEAEDRGQGRGGQNQPAARGQGALQRERRHREHRVSRGL